ncbi:MAG: 4Fe-4S dicluster domain-containing protein, partial [Candidatus Hydrogenedentes bacterium]|nr:4Fe-4S dicluster domain-containing protein [Candidatus Hydrogenedentota bacterium]
FRDDVFVVSRNAYQGSIVIFALFVAIVLLNLYRRRFWCRYLCPLGALLGLFAKRSALRLRQDADRCNDCGRCNAVCPAAAQPDLAGEWLPTECVGCWNCVAACNFNGLSFAFEAPWRRPDAAAVDLSKRATLAAGAGGLVALVGFRLTPQAQGRTYNPALIRPPGAHDERAFLQRCIQCGLCMKVCPTGGLQPAGLEASVEGLWTPVLVPRIGYCEYNCTLCGQVCPTGAIQALALPEKQAVKIGLATVDTTRCLPYASGRACIVCEEHCPVSPKAIYFVEAEVPAGQGRTRTVKQPRVDPDRCVGCGICENKCPFDDRPAIRVTSANETRQPGNQPILPGLDLPGPDHSGDGGNGADPYGGAY